MARLRGDRQPGRRTGPPGKPRGEAAVRHRRAVRCAWLSVGVVLLGLGLWLRCEDYIRMVFCWERVVVMFLA